MIQPRSERSGGLGLYEIKFEPCKGDIKRVLRNVSEEVFKNIYNALKPNGLFCFDVHNRDTFMRYYAPSSVIERDGNYMIDQSTFEPLSGRCTTKRAVMYNQSIKSFSYSIRLYSPTDIAKLFKHIGFSHVEFYENWEGKRLGQESKRMIVVATK